MEVIQNCAGDLQTQMLHRSPPFQLPVLSLRRFSYSFSSNSGSHRSRRPLRTSLPSPTPKILLNSYPQPLTTTAHSLPDDAASGLATEVVDFDPALAVAIEVKKKAIEISPELKGTSIFLVGMNGKMKTELGKLLADVMRYYYFDSDNLVEEAAGGESACKAFRERDEEGFRESETEVLRQLSAMGRLVICTGNGAVQSTTNLALLRHGLSIWINLPLDMVTRDVIEIGSQLSASKIATSGSYSEVFNQLTALYEEMRDGYATADTTVSLHKVASQLGYDDLDAVTKEDMALEVLKEIERLIRVKKMIEAASRPF